MVTVGANPANLQQIAAAVAGQKNEEVVAHAQSSTQDTAARDQARAHVDTHTRLHTAEVGILLGKAELVVVVAEGGAGGGVSCNFDAEVGQDSGAH